jgi:phosphoribosylaminoimidazolecarboxamide formyltransferase/IMP cyclohydrolase
LTPIRRALISVSDKTRLVPFARSLTELGIEIISTGGTAKLLAEVGVSVKPVEEITGFPEMMDGRVKTLHPKVHGGLLGIRDNKEHVRQAKAHGIDWIDLVVVNLYPFETTVAKPGTTLDEAIEQIDIGGPAMLRSAAKNHKFVTVITDPADYEPVLAEIRQSGETTLETRQKLALKVYRRTAEYDGAIEKWLSEKIADEKVLRLRFGNGKPLRYGENAHQKASLFIDPVSNEPSVAKAEILSGKEMSYNNYVDGDAALEAVKDLSGEIGVAVIKHTNPCGYATGASVREALERAWAGDPISAFGSVIAVNAPVDLAFAEFLKGKNVKHVGYQVEAGRLVPQDISNKFVEAIVAPNFTKEAFDLLSKTSALRLLKFSSDGGKVEPFTYRKITGGMLETDRDLALWEKFETVTKKPFDEAKLKLAQFAFKACKHTKSNAIVLAREYRPGFYQVVGMGAGQPNRVDSLRKLAVPKAMEILRIEHEALNVKTPFDDYFRQVLAECVMASDAFFPFDDTVRAAAEYNIRYIVQPGGSIHDKDSIAACDELGMAMAMTGMRHFRH